MVGWLDGLTGGGRVWMASGLDGWDGWWRGLDRLTG